MNVPPIFKSLKFWQSVSILVAAVAVQLGWTTLTDAGLILVAVLAVLNLFGVYPELRERGLIK